MEYIELSLEKSRKVTIELAEKIKKDYIPEVVVFVAKGAYQIGLDIGNYFDVPVLEIFAERHGGSLKKFLSPILKIIPRRIKSCLRKIEVNSGFHKKNIDRNVYWGYIPKECHNRKFKRILLVDDSCDTGKTFAQCFSKIKDQFPDAEIKTAALNVFSDSFSVIRTNYYIYLDCMLSGPWSNDSKEHKAFIDNYYKVFMK